MPRVSVIWVLVMAAIAGLAGYWARREQTLALLALSQSAETQKQLGLEEHRSAALNLKLIDANRSLARAREAARKQASAEADLDNGRHVIHLHDFIRQHPEYASVRNEMMRRNALRQYGNQIDKLGLPPEELTKLKGLLADLSISQSDAQVAAQQAGLKQGSPEYDRAIADARNDVTGDITALIGKDAWNALQRSSGVQYRVDQLQSEMEDIGAPLTPDQQSSVTDLLAQIQAAPQPSGSAKPGVDGGLSPQDQALLDKAAHVLTPLQLDALRESEITIRREQQMMNAAFKDAPPGTMIYND